LCLALFGVMLRTLFGLIRDTLAPTLNFGAVVSEVIFVLVMIEVVRLLIAYLEEHRVSIQLMVEVGIVAVLREIILRGGIELDWKTLLALSVFLLTLGVLLRFGNFGWPFRAPPTERDVSAPDGPVLDVEIPSQEAAR
jgi:uncharacterized membrane protein (DUF373 family)